MCVKLLPSRRNLCRYLPKRNTPKRGGFVKPTVAHQGVHPALAQILTSAPGVPAVSWTEDLVLLTVEQVDMVQVEFATTATAHAPRVQEAQAQIVSHVMEVRLLRAAAVWILHHNVVQTSLLTVQINAKTA